MSELESGDARDREQVIRKSGQSNTSGLPPPGSSLSRPLSRALPPGIAPSVTLFLPVQDVLGGKGWRLLPSCLTGPFLLPAQAC